LEHCTLILIKLDKHNNCIQGEPCDMCDRIIKKYGIKKIIMIED